MLSDVCSIIGRMTVLLAEDACDQDVSFEDLAALATLRPVPDVLDVLDVLARLDPKRLSPGGRVDGLVALRRFATWAAAQQHRFVAAMVARAAESADQLDQTGKQWVREDI